MIDQTAFGSSFLASELGVVPTIGWHLDPFGHTSTQAALLCAEAGFDAFYFGRIDYQDRDVRRRTGAMEMIWRGSDSLGAAADLFAGAIPQGSYCPPPSLFWMGGSIPTDVGQLDGTPVCTDPQLADPNGKAYVEEFVRLARQLQSYSQGQHVLLLMGCDYEYENAAAWFKNMDRLMRAVNEDGRVKAVYSDPAAYTRAKHSENLTWGLKRDDFMPISQDFPDESGLRGHMYWAGYFTSRPALKFLQRSSSAYLQAAHQLTVLANLPPSPPLWTRELWSPYTGHGLAPLTAAVSLTTHHDSVTGTSRQHVANDYAFRLAAGQAAADVIVHEALRKLIHAPPGLELYQCKSLNESLCEASTAGLVHDKGEGIHVLLFNARGTLVNHSVRIPISDDAVLAVAVTDEASGAQLPSAILAATPYASSEQRSAAALHRNPAERVVTFTAALPPLAARVYHLVPSPNATHGPPLAPLSSRALSADVVLEDERTAATFSHTTGRLSALLDKATGVRTAVTQGFFYYTARHSGPWMMRPDQSHPAGAQCAGSCTAVLQVVSDPASGKIVEVHQRFGSWVAQAARLVRGALELEWTVGPVPVVADNQSKEVFSRFTSSDIDSADRWLTDSNGWETARRTRNHRDTWTLNVTEPIAGNVVGVNAAIQISDRARNVSLVVCNDRSQGGTSLRAGEIDLFVHRRLLGFDYIGGGMGPNGEPLNESRVFSWEGDTTHWSRDGPGLVVRGTHRVAVRRTADAARFRREMHEMLFRTPVLAIAPHAGTGKGMAAAAEGGSGHARLATSPLGGLTRPLPPNVAMISLQQVPATPNAIILRLAHIYSTGEDAVLSANTTVALAGLFEAFQVTAVTELSLFSNAPLSTVRRLTWRTQGGGEKEERVAAEDGTVFDSSLERAPIRFTLGAREVIKGWDEGVHGMKVGGRRQLVVPPHLGYGTRGAPPAIPPNALLHFDVEVVAIGAEPSLWDRVATLIKALPLVK